VGGKTSTTTSQVKIPQEVLDRYNAVNLQAAEVAKNPFKQYGTTAEDFVAQINQQQGAGIANVNAAAGMAQPYIDAATGATVAGMGSVNPSDLDVDKYMNPFQQQVIDATMKQMGQANQQAQSGALGTAVSSGAFGGDRAGIAAANLANQQGMAMGSTLAGLNAQNYGQAVQTAQQQQGVNLGAEQANMARLLSGAGQIANLGTTAQTAGLQGAEAQINAGTLQQQTEQAGKTALVNQFMQEQGYPFQVAQFLANIAMGTGALSGSTTTTTQPTPFFSDRRLKEDVKRIGKTDDGLPIYKFKYKGDDSHRTHVGFMADEVEQKKPEAVGLHPSGYKTVDYDKATRNSMGGGVMPERAGQGFADGGVAGPYGSSAGSQVNFGGYVPQAYLPVGNLMTADPALMDNSNNNLAALMENSSNFGENLQKLDEQFGKDGSFWEMFRKQDDRRASGGAVYLNSPSGGLAPNSAKTYLSDTLESQSKGDKPELKTAEGSTNSGKSPAENIADLGKMAMMFLGMNSGGRVGYQDGGTETAEQRMRRLLREDVPEAQTLGSLPDATVRPSVVLPSSTAPQLPDGGLVPAIPSPPEDRLATSPRPQARPTGLVPAAAEAAAVTPRPAAAATAPTMADLSAAGIGAARMPAAPEAPAAPTGVARAAAPAEGPLTNTGTAPKGGYNAIVPLQTQLDFVMHELQQPAYDDYLKRGYNSPSEAAIAFDTIYERSGGAGNKIAAANAEDVYAAAASGDMSGLPPNVATAYNHFVQNGMDPIQAAGAAGRLMVESYAHLDPNARNTLGGGNGTYGIAQWRGDRMENLANFAGVPFDALTGAPVSTPEGRYYSTSGGSGGDGYSGGLSLSTSNKDDRGEGLGLRSFIKENAGNKDFLLSLLSGLGTMASSPSLYLGSALLQGVGGAANTYMAREQQQADIRKMDADTASVATQLVKNSIFQDPMTQESYIYLQGGGSQLFSDWIRNPAGPSAAGVEGDRILRELGMSPQGGSIVAEAASGNQPFAAEPIPVDLSTTVSQPAPSQAGMPVSPIQQGAISTGTFPINAADRAVIDRNTQTLRNMTPGQREAALAASEGQRATAVAESTAASGAFRNLNELGYVLAKASQGDMGPLGAYKAAIGGLVSQVADNFGVEYNGDAATSAALLNKLASLQADQMTSDTAAAQLFLQNKNIFPTIESDPAAAAEISAAMFVDNMADYEFGQFANDFYSNHGTFKSMDGARQTFDQKSGNIYQAEKSNISSLLRAASDTSMPKEIRDAVTMFLNDANTGAFSTPQEAQEALDLIFDAMPGEQGVSSGLGRYFVR
jgi:hypothetical protein